MQSCLLFWTQQHQGVLEKLTVWLTLQSSVIQIILFVLHTNASTERLGAVLYQRQSGKMRVIGYGSRPSSLQRKIVTFVLES